jgi:hypothetical protein
MEVRVLKEHSSQLPVKQDFQGLSVSHETMDGSKAIFLIYLALYEEINQMRELFMMREHGQTQLVVTNE